MANVIYYELKVLSMNPGDLQQISDRLRLPSTELVNSTVSNCTADHCSTAKPADEVKQNIQDLVAFEETECFDQQGIREFVNGSKYGRGLILDHLAEISEQFQNAVFLLEYYDDQLNYSGKIVIHSGTAVAEFEDNYQRTQAMGWVLPDIFTPFRLEHELKLEFGSLWEEWLDDMAAAVQLLKSVLHGDVAQAKQLAKELHDRNKRFGFEQLKKFHPELFDAGNQEGTSAASC